MSHTQIDSSRDQFNLGTMLLIAALAIIGTTITVWALHFVQPGNAAASANVTKPLPRIAVLPFHSLSNSPADLQSDQKLTKSLVAQLDRNFRVEELPSDMDTDPVLVGRELAVRLILMGKVERSGSFLRVKVQIVSAQDGKQLWTGTFNSNSPTLPALSKQIEDAVAPHLTALLD